MRTAKCLTVVCVMAAFVATAAQADFSTERPGSILIFPKVVSGLDPDTGSVRNTAIQITNTSNTEKWLRCYYINGESCIPVDFDVHLTKQQPTYWTVGEGRRVDPTDSLADGLPGIDPGSIPPIGDFRGELLCVTLDQEDGSPVASNALKGEATIGDMGSTDVAKYNAIAIRGDSANADDDLLLDGQEFNACPAELAFNFQAEGSSDAVIEDLSGDPNTIAPVSSALTLVPCDVDLENLIPGRVGIQFEVLNEFEQHFSSSTTITCWGNLSLSDTASLGGVFTLGSLITEYGTAKIVPSTEGGVIGVLTTRRVDALTGAGGTAAVNLHVAGSNPGSMIRISGGL